MEWGSAFNLIEPVTLYITAAFPKLWVVTHCSNVQICPKSFTGNPKRLLPGCAGLQQASLDLCGPQISPMWSEATSSLFLICFHDFLSHPGSIQKPAEAKGVGLGGSETQKQPSGTPSKSLETDLSIASWPTAEHMESVRTTVLSWVSKTWGMLTLAQECK